MDTLNSLDSTILRLLQEDARLTTREIGDRLHKSHSSIQNRIQRMRDAGIITGYTVHVDPEKVDLGFMTFTSVQLKDHSEETLSHFEREIIKYPEVLECHHLTGSYDFLLRIVAKDHREYYEVLMKKLFGALGVGHVETKLVMKTAKTGTPLPIKSDQMK